MSIEESEIAVRQSKVYACAYAITTTTPISDEPAYVMDDDGRTTQWPCCAKLFDNMRSAMAIALALGIPCSNVVRLYLSSYAEAALMVESVQTDEPIPTHLTPIRVA